MPVPAIRAFLSGPYGFVDDVKMLNFFRFLGVTGGIVMACWWSLRSSSRTSGAAIFARTARCMGFAALASPLRIRRDPDLVHRLREVRQSAALPRCRWTA